MQKTFVPPSFSVRLLTTLFASWKLAVGIFLCVFGLAAAFAFISHDKYRCETKVLVKNERFNPLVGVDQHTTSMIYLDTVSEARINSEIELLTSTDLLRQVIDKANLTAEEKPGEKDRTGAALKKLQKTLTVKSVRKSNIIEVSYQSRDPKKALQVVQTLLACYMDSHLRLNGAPGTFSFFDKQAADYQQKLMAAEAKLADFRKSNRIIELQEEKNLALQRAALLERQHADSEAAAQDQSKQIAVLERQVSDSAPRITKEVRSLPNQYSVEKMNTLLVELRNKQTDLAAKYQPGDRTMLEINKQIQDTEAALAAATKSEATEATTDINPLFQASAAELRRLQSVHAGTTAQAQVVAQKLQDNRERLKQLDQISAAHDDLVRQVKQLEETHAAYVQKREDARTGELLDAKQISNVAVAEEPFLPSSPASPNRPLILALGFVWALLMSIAALVAVTKLRTTLVSPADFESAISVPVLATIPETAEFLVAGPVATKLLLGEAR